jgi:hypothetical protein
VLLPRQVKKNLKKQFGEVKSSMEGVIKVGPSGTHTLGLVVICTSMYPNTTQGG